MGRVYDRSALFHWEWLRTRLLPPASWALLHAGLDEASPALRSLFPDATGQVLDIYDARLWRGNPANTAVHVILSAFWTYLVTVYGLALWLQTRG